MDRLRGLTHKTQEELIESILEDMSTTKFYKYYIYVIISEDKELSEKLVKIVFSHIDEMCNFGEKYYDCIIDKDYIRQEVIDRLNAGIVKYRQSHLAIVTFLFLDRW